MNQVIVSTIHYYFKPDTMFHSKNIISSSVINGLLLNSEHSWEALVSCLGSPTADSIFGNFLRSQKNALIETVIPMHNFLLFHLEVNCDNQKGHPLAISITKEFITSGKIISMTYERRRQAIINVAFRLIAKLLLINC